MGRGYPLKAVAGRIHKWCRPISVFPHARLEIRLNSEMTAHFHDRFSRFAHFNTTPHNRSRFRDGAIAHRAMSLTFARILFTRLFLFFFQHWAWRLLRVDLHSLKQKEKRRNMALSRDITGALTHLCLPKVETTSTEADAGSGESTGAKAEWVMPSQNAGTADTPTE